MVAIAYGDFWDGTGLNPSDWKTFMDLTWNPSPKVCSPTPSSGYSSTSFFLLFFFSTGNVDQLCLDEAGEMDFLWQEQFGGIMCLKGPFGVC